MLFEVKYYIIIIATPVRYNLQQVLSKVLVVAVVISMAMSYEKISFIKKKNLAFLVKKKRQNFNDNGKENSNNLMIKKTSKVDNKIIRKIR